MSISLIPKKKRYSIIICESISPTPYRVEGYDFETDIDILEYGTLEQCNKFFDNIKIELSKQGNYVVETGCYISHIQIPRQILINCTPYNVWKVIYKNLQIQDQVKIIDNVLTEIRKSRGIISG